ncbi:hypothetical protein NPX13_g491 [Xylaria arbuscula]|uniref:Uncharacterized protein n=1 Tax=Xylaria arbuscula TaxID=114810 RepID=A0A9W8NNS4_9PEZI|nr:hypothetical protein NPX13_g491 [Xylaria arbuscula]
MNGPTRTLITGIVPGPVMSGTWSYKSAAMTSINSGAIIKESLVILNTTIEETLNGSGKAENLNARIGMTALGLRKHRTTPPVHDPFFFEAISISDPVRSHIIIEIDKIYDIGIGHNSSKKEWEPDILAKRGLGLAFRWMRAKE